jgi:hypothetical protein
LLADFGAGALAGGLADLTKGMSLMVGVPLRAGLGAGLEAGREMLVDGCLDPVGIGLAARSSILGDATSGAVG